MAYKVKFSIPERDLGRADVEFSVRSGGSKIGTLCISKGGVDWIPRDHKKSYWIRWKEFDALMKKRGHKEK